VLDEIVELDAAAENNELNELASEIDEVDIPAVDTDDVLDEIVELDAPVENNEIEELVNEIDEVEIPAVDVDDALDDIIELDTFVENDEISKLLDDVQEDEKAELSENNNLDGLLDSTGFDFDFDLLLDEISDELKAEISEESSVIEAEIKADSFDNTLDKDAILDEEEYNAQDVVKTVESIEQTEADDSELNVDINAALDDLIDSLPFEDVLTTDSQNEINTVEEECCRYTSNSSFRNVCV
jgi:hypothetical protein